MQITQNKVVSILYTITDHDGKELDSTDAASPLVYLHGHNAMLPALESVLEGKTTGDNIELTLEPDDAFGQPSDENHHRVAIKHLQLKPGQEKKARWQPGMQVLVSTQHGQVEGTILKAGHTMATVDFNHPFAGLTLTFNVSVVDIREASEEELTHGHVHGPGGHHH